MSPVVGKNIFEDVIKQIVRLDTLGKGLAENDLEITAKISALVLLLEEKGILTTDEFDKKFNEVNVYIQKKSDDVKAMAKRNVGGSGQ
jgi:hypothetical protein